MDMSTYKMRVVWDAFNPITHELVLFTSKAKYTAIKTANTHAWKVIPVFLDSRDVTLMHPNVTQFF